MQAGISIPCDCPYNPQAEKRHESASLPACMSRYMTREDRDDDDDDDDNETDDDDEPPSGKNPHSSEAERLHNIVKQNGQY